MAQKRPAGSRGLAPAAFRLSKRKNRDSCFCGRADSAGDRCVAVCSPSVHPRSVRWPRRCCRGLVEPHRSFGRRKATFCVASRTCPWPTDGREQVATPEGRINTAPRHYQPTDKPPGRCLPSFGDLAQVDGGIAQEFHPFSLNSSVRSASCCAREQG